MASLTDGDGLLALLQHTRLVVCLYGNDQQFAYRPSLLYRERGPQYIHRDQGQLVLCGVVM
jgi:hypothetical protein